MRDLIPWSDRCIDPWFAPYIGVKGDVYPCHLIGGGDPEVAVTDYYDRIAISRNISGNLCGNIGDSSFPEIWNNIKFQQFRHKLSQINHFNFGKDYYIVRELSGQFLTSYCVACPYRWHCGC